MNGTEERRALDGVDLVMRRERDLAVAHWLLSAAGDRERARAEWREYGVALLATGGIFVAIRIPGDLIRVAAETDEDQAVDDFLRCALEGGPVFRDRISDVYYALVPGSTAWRWNARAWPGVERLGKDCYLGVPAPERECWRGRAYWCVPMDSPGELCDPRLVWAMVQLGQERHRMADAEGQVAGTSEQPGRTKRQSAVGPDGYRLSVEDS
ncbi:hypothetical protein [Streptomyces colonosanans]|uniref:Uncharacterized protein n=1 Tax=Streptomyces colonosanans TaxID=1428652 RepID=A0A1S2Q080_9ACTN|nr:hypothetical protein [Streptomyces colonosanans]OIJ98574.1 hypothetical protein BIV24_05630 [Streptomyces colonosanans]